MFEIDIVDLIFPAHLDTLQELLYAIKKHYSKYDVFKINTWLPLNDAKHILLEKIGFLNILPVTYSGIRILDKNYDNLSHAPSWVYSISNSDIY